MSCLAVSTAAAGAASNSEIAGRCVYLKLIYFTQTTTTSLLSLEHSGQSKYYTLVIFSV